MIPKHISSSTAPWRLFSAAVEAVPIQTKIHRQRMKPGHLIALNTIPLPAFRQEKTQGKKENQALHHDPLNSIPLQVKQSSKLNRT